MAQNAKWKQPDGAGGYTTVYHETTAEMVKYGSTNVKEVLDNIPSTNTSNFMREFLKAEDAFSARAVLGVAKEAFFDEMGGQWYSANAVLSPDDSKFGETSLYLNGSTSYLRSRSRITLGGKDFAISLWANISTVSSANVDVFGWGDSSTRLHVVIPKSTTQAYLYFNQSGTVKVDSKVASTFAVNTWTHFEINYRNSDNTLFLFVNGKKTHEVTVAELGTAMTYPFYIGKSPSAARYTTGYFDELLITEELLHTADFTPPTMPYTFELGNYLSLMHFGIEKISDEAGALWYNYGAEFSTAQKKFGTKSLKCSKTFLQRLSKLKLGGKDFTMSFWVYSAANTPTNNLAFFGWGGQNDRFGISRNTAGNISWWCVRGGTTILTAGGMTSTIPFTTNTWTHIEIGYRNSDNKMFLFVDGSLKEEATIPAFGTAATLPFYIGTHPVTPSLTFEGYIDEFLITEELLHDADFTPPTSAYDLDGKTLALFHFEDN